MFLQRQADFLIPFQSLHPTSHRLHPRQNSTQVKKSTGKASVSEKLSAKIWSECCVLKNKKISCDFWKILCVKEEQKQNSVFEW